MVRNPDFWGKCAPCFDYYTRVEASSEMLQEIFIELQSILTQDVIKSSDYKKIQCQTAWSLMFA